MSASIRRWSSLRTHTIKNGNATLKIGPNVNGSFDGTNLTLLSERVAATLSGQPIQRQFRLSGAISASDGSQISGEYRETMWGATHQPVTVVGAFTLQRPVFATGAPDTSNKAPNTVADNAATQRGEAVTINVLANDTDPNGDALTITAVSKPQFGAATTNGQNVTYTPKAGFAGQDSFSYFVSDGHGNTTAGSVTVIVGGQLEGHLIYRATGSTVSLTRLSYRAVSHHGLGGNVERSECSGNQGDRRDTVPNQASGLSSRVCSRALRRYLGRASPGFLGSTR